MKSSRYPHSSRSLVVAACLCGTLALISFSLVYLTSQSDSNATIIDFGGPGRSQTARFSDVLDQLGHEKPRPYRLNGNKVFISVRHARKDIPSLIKEYQHALVSNGLNDKAVSMQPKEIKSLENPKEGLSITQEAFDDLLVPLKGGLIPFQVTDDYARLVGAEPRSHVQSLSDLKTLGQVPDEKKFKAVRTIEMMAKSPQDTTIVATFTDDDFDVSKMVHSKYRARELQNRTGIYHENLPACPSCQRLQQLEDLDPQVTFIGNVYEAFGTRESLLSFYDHYFQKRGWTLGSASQLMASKGSAPETELLPDELRRQRVYLHGSEVVALSVISKSFNNHIINIQFSDENSK